jgi:HTH-type transcriptional regulator / antitoxin HigA
MLHPIRNEHERKAALARIDELMEAEDGSSEAAELQLLAILVERYEREAFPIDAPSPVDAIRFRMEQMGYTQADLARLLGSRSRASEIMTGTTKNLSINMIRRLHEQWRIPAEVLIRRAA